MPTNHQWTLTDLPDLTGRRALVTGVTSGLGRSTARELARAGAEIVLAARNRGKLEATVQQLREEVPAARLETLVVDLADLSSVRRAAAGAAATYDRIDLLVNNAGVMATPYRRTVDGLELQMATNHFGHFALTGLLLPQLVASGSARVVAVSSQMHRVTRTPPLADPRRQHGRYSRWDAYSKSKLANLLFAFELDRRARAQGLAIEALAAHPGLSATSLLYSGPGLAGTNPAKQILTGALQLAGQPAELGALPLLMAATADLPGGSYVGPRGPFEARGLPMVVRARALARDPEVARELWRVSEEVTGVRYP